MSPVSQPPGPKASDFTWPRGGDGHWVGPSTDLWGQATGGGEVEESDLGPPPILEPGLECFLGGPTPMQGARDRWGSPPVPSINNYERWLEWWAHQVDTPDWWKELLTIPDVGDPKKLVQKICTSFEVP